ncbi:MAG: phosphatidylglycerol lysyltransferase domain-containing protein, partial [Roseburia sp.]|nr:phosphatidylglycerol lysyltransferase domain-containing protein [Roseburia sp.]
MLEQKLEFHEICLSDQEWMNEKLKEDNLGACEYCFANNYLWRKVYHTEAAQLFDCGIIRFHEEGNHIVYSFPFGNGDKKKVLSYLKEQCEKEGCALELYPIVDEDRLELLEWFPGQFEVDADRDDFDYVYTVEKLSTLKGKKLHGKRNHIARFKDADDWSYEPLSDENALECKKMAFQWSKLREEKWNEEMQQELDVLTEALSLWKELHLVGGVLRKAGEIV